MFLSPYILGFLLIGVNTGIGKVLTLHEAEEAKERIDAEQITSFTLSLMMDIIKDMIRDAVFDILGITTTPAPPGPIIGFIEGILGGITSSNAGSLVMIGGNLQEDNLEIWNTLVNLAGGVNEARIGIITAANGDPVKSGEYYVDMFNRYQVAEVVWIPVTIDDPDTAHSLENVDLVRSMTGIFLGGGEPWRLAASLMMVENGVRVDTPVMEAIRDKMEAGGLVGGTSAGIMALMDTVTITGGNSWEALAYGGHVDSLESDPVNGANLTYDALGGLQIVEDVLIDAHFTEKARQGRLVKLAAETGVNRAVGVDEDTGLMCQELVCTVIGSAGVWLLDMEAAVEDNDGEHWSCKNAMTSYITNGDTIDLSSWSVEFADGKQELVEDQNISVDTSEDIFKYRAEPSEYIKVVKSLLMSDDGTTNGTTLESDPVKYRVVFRKTKETSAVLNDDGLISYMNVPVDFSY